VNGFAALAFVLFMIAHRRVAIIVLALGATMLAHDDLLLCRRPNEADSRALPLPRWSVHFVERMSGSPKEWSPDRGPEAKDRSDSP
jgi:hypothetical protein